MRYFYFSMWGDYCGVFDELFLSYEVQSTVESVMNNQLVMYGTRIS